MGMQAGPTPANTSNSYKGKNISATATGGPDYPPDCNGPDRPDALCRFVREAASMVWLISQNPIQKEEPHKPATVSVLKS